jgi:hypothetical protein
LAVFLGAAFFFATATPTDFLATGFLELFFSGVALAETALEVVLTAVAFPLDGLEPVDLVLEDFADADLLDAELEPPFFLLDPNANSQPEAYLLLVPTRVIVTGHFSSGSECKTS